MLAAGNPRRQSAFTFVSQNRRRRMAEELDRKVRTALNETRLLILGVQVLLGFEFQSFFQEGFEDLPAGSKLLSVTGLFLVIASAGLLVIPSMQHRLVEAGQPSVRLLRA